MVNGKSKQDDNLKSNNQNKMLVWN